MGLGGWFGWGWGKAVTPFMVFLESPMSFSRSVRRRYPYCPFGSEAESLHGLWQKRDEYVLMIEMMVNNTLPTRHLTVLFLVFECFCVLVVTNLKGQNLVLDGQIVSEGKVIPGS